MNQFCFNPLEDRASNHYNYQMDLRPSVFLMKKKPIRRVYEEQVVCSFADPECLSRRNTTFFHPGSEFFHPRLRIQKRAKRHRIWIRNTYRHSWAAQYDPCGPATLWPDHVCGNTQPCKQCTLNNKQKVLSCCDHWLDYRIRDGKMTDP